MRKWAQVSAWLHIHLCSCSQIQSRYFWFDPTTKGPRDGWKMRRAPTCHFNPTCFHSRALPSWPLPVRSALPGPHPDIRVFNPTPPVPRPHVQPVTSVPSPLGYTSLLQHSNSRARLCLICMHKLVVIIFEHFKWATTSTNWCLCFPFSFLFFSILHQSPRVLFDSVWRYYLKPARDNMLNRRERTLEPSNPNWYILTDSFHTSIYKDKEERISCFLSPVFFYLY